MARSRIGLAFLARLGAGGEAEAILASQNARFADAMNTVRPVVDRIARKKAARNAKATGDAAGHRGRPFWRRRALTATRARLLRLARRLRARMPRL